MKKVIIEPVKQRPEGVSDATFQDAKKAGPKEVNYITAVEAMRNSKGLYQIKQPPKPEVVIKSLKEPEEMDNDELAREAALYGKPVRKRVTRPKLVEFIKKLRSESVSLIVDEDEDDGGDE